MIVNGGQSLLVVSSETQFNDKLASETEAEAGANITATCCID